MADNQVGNTELWQLCFHCLTGNKNSIQKCIDNGLVGRFPMKDLLLVQCIANNREDALKLLLRNVEPEYFSLRQSTVNF
jgi:hypothetical protein